MIIGNDNMETVQGTVSAVHGHTATVVVESAPVCPRCASGNGCGAGIFAAGQGNRNTKVHTRMTSDMRFDIGDEVELSIGGSSLLRAACLAYGLPMLSILGFLLLATTVLDVVSDFSAVVFSVFGLVFGLLGGRWLLRRDSLCQRFVPELRSVRVHKHD